MSQTEDLLKYGRTSGTGRTIGMKAHASGTASNGISAYGSSTGSWHVSSGITGGGAGTTINTNGGDVNINSGGSSSGGGSDSSEEQEPETFDWVEKRLEYFAEKVEDIADQISDYVSFAFKKIKLTQQRSAIDTQISANEKAYDAYMKKANSIKLSENYKKKIREGDYSIEDILDEDVREAISDYEEFYGKAQDCLDTIQELKTTQLELFEDLMNLPIEEAENKIDRLTKKYSAMESVLSGIGNGKSTIVALKQARNDATAERRAAYEEAKQNRKDARTVRDNLRDVVVPKAQKKLEKKYNKLTAADKKTAKNKDGTYDLTGIDPSKSRYKRLNAYNQALKDSEQAKKDLKKAKNNFNEANKEFVEIREDYKALLKEYYMPSVEGANRNTPTYVYQNKALDDQLKNLKKQAEAQQQALEATYNNMDAAKMANQNAEYEALTKGSEISSKYGSKLTKDQKNALKNGKIVSVAGLSGDILSDIKKYNKLVETSNTKSREYTIALTAEQTAAEAAANATADYATALVQNELQKIENIKKFYESDISYLQALSDLEQSRIDELETRGMYAVEEDYQRLIDIKKNEIELLTKALEELNKQLEESVKKGLIIAGSEEWNEMKKSILEVSTAINKARAEQQEYINEIGNLPFKEIERTLKYLDAFSGALDSKIKISLTKGISQTYEQYSQQEAELLNKLNEYNKERELAWQNYNKANGEKDYVLYGKDVQTWLTEYYEYEDKANEMLVQIEEVHNAMANIPYEKIEKALKLLEAEKNDLASIVSYNKYLGKYNDEETYTNQINANLEKQKVLLDRLGQLRRDADRAEKDPDQVYGGKQLSEWQQEIHDTNTQLNNLLGENKELKDSLRDEVYWRQFEKMHHVLEQTYDILAGLDSLMDEDMFFDDEHNITEYGNLKIANTVKQYETAREQIVNYQKDVEYLKYLFDQGFYEGDSGLDEFNDKLNELQQAMLDNASDMQDAMKTIMDMYRELGENELNNLLDIIDKRNDALKAKKEYYDYDKNIKKKTNDIKTLEAQIAALEGVATAEAKAKRATLQAQLKEARDDLDDTVKEHEFDISIKALDELRKMLEDEFDDDWKTVEGDLDKMLELLEAGQLLTQTSASELNETLSKLLQYYSIKPIESGIVSAAGYASGSKSIDKDKMAWTNERNSEMIIRKSDGAVLTKLSKGDGVIPSNLTSNLFKLGAYTPDALAYKIANSIRVPDGARNTSTNYTQNYDSLIHIDGNVDSTVVTDLKKFAQEFYKGSYEYTMREISRDARKIGLKR